MLNAHFLFIGSVLYQWIHSCLHVFAIGFCDTKIKSSVCFFRSNFLTASTDLFNRHVVDRKNTIALFLSKFNDDYTFI